MDTQPRTGQDTGARPGHMPAAATGRGARPEARRGAWHTPALQPWGGRGSAPRHLPARPHRMPLLLTPPRARCGPRRPGRLTVALPRFDW